MRDAPSRQLPGSFPAGIHSGGGAFTYFVKLPVISRLHTTHMTPFFLLLAAFTVLTSAAAQNVDSLETAALQLHYAMKYTEAADVYTKVIDGGKRTFNTYFNRGACLAECCDPMKAAADFTKAMEFQQSDSALYMRAVCYVKATELAKGVADLNVLLERNLMFPHALALRGQAYYALGARSDACTDLTRAASMGDVQAAALAKERCDTAATVTEGVLIDWPQDKGPWKQVDSRDDSAMSVVVLRREREIGKDWTELGMMTSMKRVYRAHPDSAMSVIYAEARKQAVAPKLTVLDRGTTEERPWVIFSIEAATWNSDKHPESQIYYVIQGKAALYIIHRDVRRATLTPRETKKWVAVFKKATIKQQ